MFCCLLQFTISVLFIQTTTRRWRVMKLQIYMMYHWYFIRHWKDRTVQFSLVFLTPTGDYQDLPWKFTWVDISNWGIHFLIFFLLAPPLSPLPLSSPPPSRKFIYLFSLNVQVLGFSHRSAPGVWKYCYWYAWYVDKSHGDLFLTVRSNYV